MKTDWARAFILGLDSWIWGPGASMLHQEPRIQNLESGFLDTRSWIYLASWMLDPRSWIPGQDTGCCILDSGSWILDSYQQSITQYKCLFLAVGAHSAFKSCMLHNTCSAFSTMSSMQGATMGATHLVLCSVYSCSHVKYKY